MNILYIEHYAGSPQMGMEFRPYYLSREWVRMGHRVDIFAADYSHLRAKNPVIDHDFQEETVDGIHYHWVHTGTYEGNGAARAVTMAQFVGKLWRRAGKIARELKPDVIIDSSTYPLDTYAGQRIRRASGAVLIHEVHDMWPATLNEVGGMSKKNPFYILMQIAENKAYRGSDYVVSLPPLAESYMKRHGLRDGGFVHVPNGIVEEEWENPEALPEPHRSALEQLKNEHKFIVGYFGGHAISNALDVLVEAAKRNKDPEVAFVLVGDGVEKEALVKSARGMDNICFLPKIPKKAVPSLVQYFDCSYVGAKNSSLYRFGLCMNKIFDSMRAGKPIICAISTPDDLILRHRCGLMVESNDPDGINGAVERLRAMPREEREALGRNGQDAVKAYYTYTKLAEGFAKCFVK